MQQHKREHAGFAIKLRDRRARLLSWAHLCRVECHARHSCGTRCLHASRHRRFSEGNLVKCHGVGRTQQWWWYLCKTGPCILGQSLRITRRMPHRWQRAVPRVHLDQERQLARKSRRASRNTHRCPTLWKEHDWRDWAHLEVVAERVEVVARVDGCRVKHAARHGMHGRPVAHAHRHAAKWHELTGAATVCLNQAARAMPTGALARGMVRRQLAVGEQLRRWHVHATGCW